MSRSAAPGPPTPDSRPPDSRPPDSRPPDSPASDSPVTGARSSGDITSAPPAPQAPVVLTARSAAAIAAMSVIGLLAFLWPLVAPAQSELVAHAVDAPLIFGVLVPALLAVTLSLVNEGAVGAKAIAMLGLLAAVAAALRALGAGIAGLEPIWIVVVLGGFALGPGFGFILGPVCLIASAMLTGGVGPWLPFQMMGAAWVGLGAGALGVVMGRASRAPREGAGPGRSRLIVLAVYAAVAAVAYGWLLNLWFWPTLTGLPEALSFVPGADPATNLRHWIAFNLTTSLGYDVPRALLTATGVLLIGGRVLASLTRVTRRAAFGAVPRFESP